jgi:riboflavin kinase/FMN adenylyltransferase
VIAYPTDWDLLRLTPEQFFTKILREEMHAAGLVEGPNFFFGHNRAGNVETLRAFCAAAGLAFEVVPPTYVGSRLASSSEVRSLIAGGQLAEAVELLGHPYRVRGMVSRGAARGRTIGFPTANLTGIETLLPPDGVYAGITHVLGAACPAAIHIGPNPTFGESERKVEVHVIGFSGDLYDSDLNVDFVDRVRDTKRFERSEELPKQLERDVETVRTAVLKYATESSAAGAGERTN